MTLLQLSANENNRVLSSKVASQLTIADAIKSPSLSRIVRESGEEVCQARIAKILTEFGRFLRTDLTIEDYLDYAELLMNDFPTLKFDEMIYTLKQTIKGNYGKTFPNWRYSDLREWLDKSYKEVIALSENEHHKHKDQSSLESRYGRSSEKQEKPVSIDEALIQMEIKKMKK